MGAVLFRHRRETGALGQSTDQDLTGPAPHSIEGGLLELREGQPLQLILDNGKTWSTSPVARLERGGERGRVVEVITRRTVYRLRYLV